MWGFDPTWTLLKAFYNVKIDWGILKSPCQIRAFERDFKDNSVNTKLLERKAQAPTDKTWTLCLGGPHQLCGNQKTWCQTLCIARKQLYIDTKVQERERGVDSDQYDIKLVWTLLLGAIVFVRVVAVRHSRAAIHEWGGWWRHYTHGRHMWMTSCHLAPRCLHWITHWSMVHCNPDATRARYGNVGRWVWNGHFSQTAITICKSRGISEAQTTQPWAMERRLETQTMWGGTKNERKGYACMLSSSPLL
jgi:hypothetical protein